MRIVTGDAARENVAAEPCNVLIYAPPGFGKTTDAIKAFTSNGRCNAFYIPCEDGALKNVYSMGLPIPDHPEEPIKSWKDFQEVGQWLAQHRDRYSAVITDTLSSWTAYVYRQLEEHYKGQKNKFLIPVEMRNYLYNIREGFRQLGLHVVYIAHSMPPIFDESGAFKAKGGPLLIPKTAIDLFHGVIDTMLRGDVVNIGMRPQRVYFTGGELWPEGSGFPPSDVGLWRVKNREGCNHMVVEADLGKYLRARQPPFRNL